MNAADQFLADFGCELEKEYGFLSTGPKQTFYSAEQRRKRRQTSEIGQKYRLNPSKVVIGNTRGEGRQFLVGKSLELDSEWSTFMLSVTPWSKLIRFELVPVLDKGLPFQYFPEWMDATIEVDDILNRGLALTALHNDDGGYEAIITISLRRPPRIRVNYEGNPNAQGCGHMRGLTRRTTEMDWCENGSVEGDTNPLDPLPSTGDRSRLFINFGQWLAYQFTFQIRNRDLDSLRQTLQSIWISENASIHRGASSDSGRQLVNISRFIMQEIPRQEALTSVIDRLQDMVGVPYDIKFCIVGLITRGVILLDEFAQVWRLLKIHAPEKQLWILRALYKEERIYNFHKTLRNYSRMYTDKLAPPSVHSVPVRKIMVTPTRVIPCPPEMEVSNRVLRHFKDHLDRFARVQFTEEDGTKLFVDDTIRNVHNMNPREGILSRILTALQAGVRVAGRLYTFVAYSDAMAKTHQAWFVAEEGDFTADAIRHWMGNFASEKIIAKHASRLGLCFSSTRAVDDVQFEMISDIKHGDYTYTDGVGMISKELAKRCAESVGMAGTLPAAVQIRFAGFKGMLTISDDTEGNRVLVRPSMLKFMADHRSLGVCQVATYARGYLSRQSILLMEALGVPGSCFIERFRAQVDRATSLSNAQRSLDAYREMRKRRAYQRSNFPINQLLTQGFQNETLLRNVLRVLQCRVLHDLKYRARMEIDRGALLLGIADEFGVLAEGQVFCSVLDPDSGADEPTIIKGACTIFRAPALHPGDVRRVTAIDHPHLRHLVNVVVFPTTKGKRDLPSMLGGGDLDGDTFTIIWDHDLIVPLNYDAMDYTPPISPKVPDVTISDVQNFFIEFMKHDKLGVISSHHMAIADMYGPFSYQAIKLAQLASLAADFAKTGVPAPYSTECDGPRLPDFMEGNPKNSYPSEKVLGTLFRIIDPAPVFEPLTDIWCDSRIERLAPLVPDRYFRKAGAAKRAYDVDLGGIMRRYGMDEAEVVGGMCTTPAEKRKRRERDDNLRGPVKEAFDELVRVHRADAVHYCEENPVPLLEASQAFAIAAYLCTNSELYRKRYVESPADDEVSVSSFGGGDDYALEEGELIEVYLLSFPFLVVQHLLEAVVREPRDSVGSSTVD